MNDSLLDLPFQYKQTVFVIDLTGTRNNIDSFDLERYNLNKGKWLVILNKKDPDLYDIIYLKYVLKTIDITLICDLTIALEDQNHSALFKVYSAYKIAVKQTLMVEYLGFWNNSFYLKDRRESFYPNHKNFQRNTIRTLKVDRELNQEFSDAAPMLVFHQSLYNLLKKVHNFKYLIAMQN